SVSTNWFTEVAAILVYRVIAVIVSHDATTTAIYTLSLHDALPISAGGAAFPDRVAVLLHARLSSLGGDARAPRTARALAPGAVRDRKSTRLNSSHVAISYAVFCL